MNFLRSDDEIVIQKQTLKTVDVVSIRKISSQNVCHELSQNVTNENKLHVIVKCRILTI